MQSVKFRERKFCPITKASFTLSSKWDLVVIYNLMNGKMRFSELKKIMGGEQGVTSSSLSRILKKLESQRIVRRIVDPDPTVRVFYELTPKGKDLQGVIEELYAWGIKYLK